MRHSSTKFSPTKGNGKEVAEWTAGFMYFISICVFVGA